jgi:hypothetical protein
MTVAEGRLRLKAVNGDAEAQAQLAQIRAQRADHAVKLRMIRIDRKLALAKIEQQRRDRERCRDQIAASTDVLTATLVKGRGGRPLRVLDGIRLVDCWRETAGGDPSPVVLRYREHIQALAREQRIQIEWGAHWRRGIAWPGLRLVRLPAVNSAWSAASAYHEIGHVVQPCEKTHRRVTTELGDSVCPTCEVCAWLFGIDVALDWCPEMHRNLSGALETYRPYATREQDGAIVAWQGPIGFRRAQLRRATRARKD